MVSPTSRNGRLESTIQSLLVGLCDAVVLVLLQCSRVLFSFFGVFFQKIGQNKGLSGNGGHHRLRHAKMLRVHGFKPIFGVFGVFFEKIGQNGRPRGREPPRSISFDETSRMVSNGIGLRSDTKNDCLLVVFWYFFRKSVKTAVLEDGNPPGASVLSKLSE